MPDRWWQARAFRWGLDVAVLCLLASGLAACGDGVTWDDADAVDSVLLDSQSADAAEVSADGMGGDAVDAQDTGKPDALVADGADGEAPDVEADQESDLTGLLDSSDAADDLPGVPDATDAPDLPELQDVETDQDAVTPPDSADLADSLTTTDADDASVDTPDVPQIDPNCPYDPAIVCLHWGVCLHPGAKVICGGAEPECDYSGVVGYEQIEKSCDGLDNDCNNLIDDSLQPEPASKQGGLCAGMTKSCGGQAGWQDPPFQYVPFFETVETSCDGLDNDCDGNVDSFSGPMLPAGAQGVCASVPMICQGAGGWVAPDPTVLPFHEDLETMCDDLDNDCDGLTDEELDTANFLGSGVTVNNQGVCGGALIRCLAGVWSPPDYAQLPGFQTQETWCDGEDNDCDGVVDDVEPPLASKQAGVCAGQVLQCVGKVGWQDPDWSLVPGYSEAGDWTCDGVDNDCDGVTDQQGTCPLWQVGGSGAGHVALSADGAHTAWTTATGVQVLKTATGTRERDWWGHTQSVHAAAFSAQGGWLATVGEFDVLAVWPLLPDLQVAAYAQAPKWALSGVGIPFYAVAFSPDGGRVAVGDAAGVVRVYMVWSGQQVAFLVGHQAPVRALAWTAVGPDANDQILSGDDNGILWRWSVATKTGVSVASLGGAIRSVSAMPQGVEMTQGAQMLVVAGQQAQVLDATTGHVDALLPASGGQWTAGVLRTDGGGQALLTDTQGAVNLFALPTPTEDSPELGPVSVWQPPPALTGLAPASIAAAAGQVVVGYSGAGPWHVGPTAGDWSALTTRHTGPVHDVDVSGDILLSAGEDSSVRLWHTGNGMHLLDLWGHTGAVRTVLALSQLPVNTGSLDVSILIGGGLWLASGSSDFSVRLWSVGVDAGTLSVLNPKTVGLGGPWPEDLALTADVPGFWASGGPTLTKISADPAKLGQKLNAWPTKLGNIIQRVVPSPDGKSLAVGLTGDGPAKTVHYRVISAQGFVVQLEWSNLPTTVHAVAWSPDGQRLALAATGGQIHVVHAVTGVLLQTLTGHTGDITSLTWAPIDQLVSTAQDGTARLWRTSGPTVLPAGTLTRHCPAQDGSVAVLGARWLDATGRRLTTWASDGSLITWQTPVP